MRANDKSAISPADEVFAHALGDVRIHASLAADFLSNREQLHMQAWNARRRVSEAPLDLLRDVWRSAAVEPTLGRGIVILGRGTW